MVPIKHYEGYYSISEDGRVYSEKKQHGRFVKETGWMDNLTPNNKGYLVVTLCHPEGTHCKLVHRIVAEHFIPNPDNLPQVNHKDRNKYNNAKSNLEWVTAQDNSLHAVTSETGKAGGLATRKLNCEQVKVIRERYKNTPDGYARIALTYGVTAMLIKAVVEKKTYKDC